MSCAEIIVAVENLAGITLEVAVGDAGLGWNCCLCRDTWCSTSSVCLEGSGCGGRSRRGCVVMRVMGSLQD